MPGYDTHYIFGMSALAHFNDNAKRLLKSKKSEFTLGLFGPDLFFYSVAELASVDNNIGSIIHKIDTGKFFKNMHHFALSQDTLEKRDAALAYFLGFVGHYYLDTHCHPYVYSKTGDSTSKHFELETDINIYLFTNYLGDTKSSYKKRSRLWLKPASIILLSDMLHYSINETYPDNKISALACKLAVVSILAGEPCLKACNDTAKKMVCTVESKVMGSPYISQLMMGSGHIHNDDPLNTKHDAWSNPWIEGHISTKSFLNLMDDAKEKYIEVVNIMGDILHSDCNDNDNNINAIDGINAIDPINAMTNLFFNKIGNKSYQNGLEL